MKTQTSILTLVAIVIIGVGMYFYFIPKNSPVMVENKITETQAFDLIIAEHPELSSYKNTSLPPSSIESKQTAEGWYFGFIRQGSGLPGILDAKCYQVRNIESEQNINDVIKIGEYVKQDNTIVDNIALETCQPIKITTQNPPVSNPKILAYGNTSLRLGEMATFKNISIRPLSIEEDSRCPLDVQCIQAGTVRVKIQVVSSRGSSPSIVKLDEQFSTEGVVITLTGVSPNKNSQVQVSNKDYVLVFNVVPQGTPIVKNPQNKCYVGGCSSQLCTNQPNAVSTCEYTEKYACYKTATCERQPSGECGWTPTPTLNACLVK